MIWRTLGLLLAVGATCRLNWFHACSNKPSTSGKLAENITFNDFNGVKNNLWNGSAQHKAADKRLANTSARLQVLEEGLTAVFLHPELYSDKSKWKRLLWKCKWRSICRNTSRVFSTKRSRALSLTKRTEMGILHLSKTRFHVIFARCVQRSPIYLLILRKYLGIMWISAVVELGVRSNWILAGSVSWELGFDPRSLMISVYVLAIYETLLSIFLVLPQYQLMKCWRKCLGCSLLLFHEPYQHQRNTFFLRQAWPRAWRYDRQNIFIVHLLH